MISIIVPIYNVEKYLVACVDSILNSTYQDFELILVDDGSTDLSGTICNEYELQDERVKVVHKQNRGLADARNAGLNISQGKYISFIDGDDVIHPNMLQVMVDAIQKDDYDFSMVLHQEVSDSENIALLSNPKFGFSCRHRDINQEECLFGLISPVHSDLKYNYVWNKLYKRSFVGDARFIVTAIEDMEFNNRLYLKMNKAVLVEAELYYYVQRPSSLTHAGGVQRAVNRLESFSLCLHEVPQRMTWVRAKYLERLYDEMIRTYYTTRHAQSRTSVKERNDRIYYETHNDFMHSDISMLKKYAILLFLKKPSLFIKLATPILTLRKKFFLICSHF